MRLGVTAGLLALTSACTEPGTTQPPLSDEAYVGSAVCAQCHDQEQRLWRGSLHAWAMKESQPQEASGSFDGARARWGSDGRARLLRTGEGLEVDMEDPPEPPVRHALRYFFGRLQIEQHLVRFPGGRLQALPLGFDTVKGDWFDIFEGEQRGPADWGYWTKLGMTANSQCLYCHTTNFAKGYKADSDSYASSWSEMAVGCEACHGPGGRHAALRAADGAGNATATKASARTDHYATADAKQLMDVCATCHALRREIAEGFRPGDALLDYFDPVLLDSGDYYSDGQILGEDYEWGSFLQSTMYGEDVVCQDCHDPHSGARKAEGSKLCLTCHDPELARSEHTHHQSDSPGANCIECHMPATVYMARDVRRDHSFSTPDPQATVELGVPNACGRCHGEQGAAWAADQVAKWYVDTEASARRAKRRLYARAFLQARQANPEAIERLLDCVSECDSEIRRASALRALAPFASRAAVSVALAQAVASGEALVRNAATWALSESGSADQDTRHLLYKAAGDPIRAVRLNAAWGLRGSDLEHLSAKRRDRLLAGFAEWEASMITLGEHAESHHSLGAFYGARHQGERAIASYRRAIELASDSVPSRYNLAMLLVSLGREGQAQAELIALTRIAPRFAPAHYALDLLHGANEHWSESVESLSECLRLEPSYPGALHELAHAYVKMGAGNIANVVLEAALNYSSSPSSPSSRGSRAEALATLVSVNRELGDGERAKRWALMLEKEAPELLGSSGSAMSE